MCACSLKCSFSFEGDLETVESDGDRDKNGIKESGQTPFKTLIHLEQTLMPWFKRKSTSIQTILKQIWNLCAKNQTSIAVVKAVKDFERLDKFCV